MPIKILPRGLLALSFLAFWPAFAAAPEPAAAIDLSRYSGNVVIVDFWASWCVPCRRSFPWMNAIQRKYAAAGLHIIAVNEDKEWQHAARFLEEYPAEFEIVRDSEGRLARRFDVIAMPSSYVFDRSGQLIARHLGFKSRSKKEYETVIQNVLDGSKATFASADDSHSEEK